MLTKLADEISCRENNHESHAAYPVQASRSRRYAQARSRRQRSAVEVRACGICGSDIHGWDGSSGRRIPPLVMGHEAAGVVAAVGANVSDFKIGDRVTFDSTVSCGQCPSCRSGRINLCQNRQVLGVSCNEFRRHGAFAEYVVVPQNISYHLPAELSFEHAALIEAVSIAVHAANRTPVKLGDTAVVMGSGMIGLLVIQAIRLAGAAKVIAVDLDDNKLKIAQSLGADVVLNAKNVNAPQEVATITGGRGADVGIEVVGATATIQSTIDCVKRGGAITLVGNLAPRLNCLCKLSSHANYRSTVAAPPTASTLNALSISVAAPSKSNHSSPPPLV